MFVFSDNSSSTANTSKRIARLIFFFFIFFLFHPVFAQTPIQPNNLLIDNSEKKNVDLYKTQTSFISNIGQYGKVLKGYENMSTIQYGYEGLDMPVLITPKGLIHLQRKIE